MGQFRADVDLDLGIGRLERLRVGVRRDELDAAQARVNHPADGVRAGAADADDLYDREIVTAAVHVFPSL